MELLFHVQIGGIVELFVKKSLDTLLGTIALNGDLLFQGTIASCFIMFVRSGCFTNMFLPEALTHEQSGQLGAVTRAWYQKANHQRILRRGTIATRRSS